MRIPLSPPNFEELTASVISGPGRMQRLSVIIQSSESLLADEKYRHWDILRHLEPPSGMTLPEWWLGISMARRGLLRELPLLAVNGEHFKYMRPIPAERLLHEIDKYAGGMIGGNLPRQIATPGTRDRYLIKSLMEE